ncbi:hypothetical protein AB0J01_27830 [Streptomyces sp. NPDC050204]|uniref:hypothetical protein n=1 Tax=Streptomyces sp. NPDC050204 TaxID=3155514 RepID=UPI00341D7388
MVTPPTDPDRVLAVNVTRRWDEIRRGIATEADVVLGAWSPWVGRSRTRKHFDPDAIAVVLACKGGKTMAVYEIRPDSEGKRWHWAPGVEPPRIVFHGRPSQRYAAQISAPAPSWAQGEGVPIKLLGLDDLIEGDGSPHEGRTASRQRHALVGNAVVTLDGANHLTVSVPAHYTVTVTTREPHVRSH